MKEELKQLKAKKERFEELSGLDQGSSSHGLVVTGMVSGQPLHYSASAEALKQKWVMTSSDCNTLLYSEIHPWI